MILALTRPPRRTVAPLLLSALFGLTAVPVLAADPSEFSLAEKLVFVEHQLANVKAPASLHYTYVRSGSLEPGFEDEVRIDVKLKGKVCCTVQGSFLTGERKMALPEIEEAQANPVILYFLERDIREMERVTKGKSGYFRKRIRMTMVDEAKVRDTKVSYEGREVDAQEVSLTPYETDPLRARFETYAQKRYTFVLASTVPGGVYQVRTAVPGALPSDAPVLEEVMTFAGPVAGNKQPSKK
ncbi:hypothetical protein C1M51_06820 [Methylibium sp. Pch-M]|uniref:hypothetical protein n=1 Tax=Methylibium sp. Pch-M TaxID=2082386 RepID=UPI0010120135|nr:hypothetical protein [Methylibium sp. Pch-M]QAZ39169.1 hypothetical protein C1M51_06820 [Methylibium sp. Pch-M]